VRQPLAITGTSAVTAVGADVEQTCASIRAGIRAGREHAWFETEGWDPAWDATSPLLAAPVRDVDPTLGGPERLLHLIVPALADLVKAAKLRRADLAECALLVALPEADEAVDAWRLDATLVPELCRRTGLAFKVTRVSRAGRVGGLALLEEASALIGAREVQSAIVAGVDSYLSGDRMALLDRQHRLKSPRNVDGFIPGEAGAALYVEAPRRAEARRVPVLATVAALGLGEEPHPLRGDRQSSGRGLTEALRAVVPAQARWVLCDLNGESYRSFEWGVIRSRMGAPLGDVERLVHPAASLGDVGAATGPVLAACVAAAFQRGYAPADEAVLWASSDGAARAAVRIERAR
jgi:3-oxoacyl-[acyl-carrier-protein] synthase-1